MLNQFWRSWWQSGHTYAQQPGLGQTCPRNLTLTRRRRSSCCPLTLLPRGLGPAQGGPQDTLLWPLGWSPRWWLLLAEVPLGVEVLSSAPNFPRTSCAARADNTAPGAAIPCGQALNALTRAWDSGSWESMIVIPSPQGSKSRLLYCQVKILNFVSIMCFF